RAREVRVRRAPRPAPAVTAPALSVVPSAPPPPLVDAASDFPDVIGEVEPQADTLFDVAPASGDYVLPDRGILRRSAAVAAGSAEASARVAETLVGAL